MFRRKKSAQRIKPVRSRALFFFAVHARTWQTSSSKMTHGRLALGVLLVLVSTLSGCAHVAAYERGKLAHPTMAPSDGTSVAREHVYAIQEGPMGGSVGAASGCGCN